MTTSKEPYVRPAIDAPVFRDASGAVIDYGNRWDIDEPPEDTYSVTSNLERLAPLHTIADALIAHLVSNFDGTVEASADCAADLLHEREDVIKAVRVTPASAQAATLTFVFTSQPSVIVHAGVLQDLLYPVCNCDACDESWWNQADEMEWQVQAVVAGGFLERFTRGPRVKYYMDLRCRDASIGSGGSKLSEHTRDLTHAARKVLKGLPDGWQPWPPRDAKE